LFRVSLLLLSAYSRFHAARDHTLSDAR
jgi:hypothetical protein